MRKRASSSMVITMKGFLEGLKIIVKIFTVQKEHEIEIGYPTDVRHVSHIGLGGSHSCPSWMNEFRGLEQASVASVGCGARARQTSWASLDLEQPIGVLSPAEVRPDNSIHDAARTGTATGPTTTTGWMRKSRSSPAVSSSAARSPSWRSTASFVTACDGSGEPQSAVRVAA